MASLRSAKPRHDAYFRTRPAQPRASLPLRYALRELRGGLRGFYVFIACIALGVMAIAASLSRGELSARPGARGPDLAAVTSPSP